MTERLQPDAFEQLLERTSAPLAQLARGARSLVLGICPETFETVWLQQGTVGWGTGPRKMSEHFSWLQFTRAYVQLGFNYGAELDDPAGLLEGTGAKMRHVKLCSPADLEKPELAALVRKAVRHRVPPPRPLSAPSAEAAGKPRPVRSGAARGGRPGAARAGAAARGGKDLGTTRKTQRQPTKKRH